MKIENVDFVRFEMTENEYDVLAEAKTILEKIHCAVGENARLYSLDKGEVVFSNELPLVRGILSFFIDYDLVEVTYEDD